MRDEKGNDYENSLTIIDNKIKQKNEGIFKMSVGVVRKDGG